MVSYVNIPDSRKEIIGTHFRFSLSHAWHTELIISEQSVFIYSIYNQFHLNILTTITVTQTVNSFLWNSFRLSQTNQYFAIIRSQECISIYQCRTDMWLKEKNKNVYNYNSSRTSMSTIFYGVRTFGVWTYKVHYLALTYIEAHTTVNLYNSVIIHNLQSSIYGIMEYRWRTWRHLQVTP